MTGFVVLGQICAFNSISQIVPKLKFHECWYRLYLIHTSIGIDRQLFRLLLFGREWIEIMSV